MWVSEWVGERVSECKGLYSTLTDSRVRITWPGTRGMTGKSRKPDWVRRDCSSTSLAAVAAVLAVGSIVFSSLFSSFFSSSLSLPFLRCSTLFHSSVFACCLFRRAAFCAAMDRRCCRFSVADAAPSRASGTAREWSDRSSCGCRGDEPLPRCSLLSWLSLRFGFRLRIRVFRRLFCRWSRRWLRRRRAVCRRGRACSSRRISLLRYTSQGMRHRRSQDDELSSVEAEEPSSSSVDGGELLSSSVEAKELSSSLGGSLGGSEEDAFVASCFFLGRRQRSSSGR